MSNVLQRYPNIAALHQALSNRQLSATELAQDCLRQIELHASLNAFVHIDADLTLAQAREADNLLPIRTSL